MSRSMKFALMFCVLGLFAVGCDSSEPPAPPKGEMSGSMEKGKMEGGMMDKGKMEGGMMDKGKMEGGSMEKGKMEGGMMEKGEVLSNFVDGGKENGGVPLVKYHQHQTCQHGTGVRHRESVYLRILHRAIARRA